MRHVVNFFEAYPPVFILAVVVIVEAYLQVRPAIAKWLTRRLR